jgi:hypothetical protein
VSQARHGRQLPLGDLANEIVSVKPFTRQRDE